MKKNIIGNVVTGDEKLFLEITLGKKKTGIEQLFLKKPTSANHLQQSSINNLMKTEYSIKDDYNEEIIKGDGTARIGITLTNFMNKIDKLLPILNKYINLIDDFDINKMKKLYAEIKGFINKFKLTEIKDDYNISEALLGLYNISENKDKLKYCKNLIETTSKEDNIDEEFFNISRFIESLFHLKNNYYSYDDLIWITFEILEKQDNIQQNYNLLLLDIIKKLEDQLNEKVNEAIKELIHHIFKNFYNDYNFASSPSNLFDFLVKTKNNMENNPYNTYYKEIYNYIFNIQHDSISRKENKEYDKIKRFEEFSLQQMSKIFINTLIEDISYILNNYNNIPDFISNDIIISKNTHSHRISSFYELFYISRYYIEEDGNNLAKCNLCGRFFITQIKKNEQHCRRKFTKKFNCSEYANFNTGKSNSINSQIYKEKNSILSMLRKRDLNNHTSELTEFNMRLKLKKAETNTKEDLLDWLKLEHEELKKSKK